MQPPAKECEHCPLSLSCTQPSQTAMGTDTSGVTGNRLWSVLELSGPGPPGRLCPCYGGRLQGLLLPARMESRDGPGCSLT